MANNANTSTKTRLNSGKTEEEILDTLKDLRSVGCDRVTLGQYLQPSLDRGLQSEVPKLHALSDRWDIAGQSKIRYLQKLLS